MEGGSANDYDYSNGDPINQFDLSGLGPCPPLLHRTRSDGSHYCKGNAAKSAGQSVARALDRAWDASGGKVFTCDANGVNAFIENFGLFPSISGTDADRASAARYVATQNAGTVLGGLNELIKAGQLRASTKVAARVAMASNVGIAVTAASTVYQVSRFFAC